MSQQSRPVHLPCRLLAVIAVLVLTSIVGSVQASTFTIARLKYDGGGDWYSNPTSLPRLLEHLRKRSPVLAGTEEAVVTLDDSDLFRYPLIYATGHGNIRLTGSQQENLRRYLEGGGFFWADDNYGLDESFRREMERLYPDKELVALPFDHPIYRIRHTFEAGPPKVHKHDDKPPQGLALFVNGRVAVFYTYESDVGDGLEHESVHNDPPGIRERAMEFAENVVLYALTGP